jgi:hypothetical protein
MNIHTAIEYNDKMTITTNLAFYFYVDPSLGTTWIRQSQFPLCYDLCMAGYKLHTDDMTNVMDSSISDFLDDEAMAKRMYKQGGISQPPLNCSSRESDAIMSDEASNPAATIQSVHSGVEPTSSSLLSFRTGMVDSPPFTQYELQERRDKWKQYYTVPDYVKERWNRYLWGHRLTDNQDSIAAECVDAVNDVPDGVCVQELHRRKHKASFVSLMVAEFKLDVPNVQEDNPANRLVASHWFGKYLQQKVKTGLRLQHANEIKPLAMLMLFIPTRMEIDCNAAAGSAVIEALHRENEPRDLREKPWIGNPFGRKIRARQTRVL